MAAGQSGQNRPGRGNDEFPENLLQGERPLRVLGGAVGPGPQNHPGTVLKFPRVAQLGEHAVDAVDLLPHVLQKEEFSPRVDLPRGTQRGGQEGEVAAAQPAHGAAWGQGDKRLSVGIFHRPGQRAEEAAAQLGHGALVHRPVVVGGGHGGMEGDKAAHLVEGGVEGGDVAVPGEELRAPGNGIQVQQGEDAVGAVAPPKAQHTGDGVVGKGGLEVGGPLDVVGGKITVAAGGVAGGVGHRLQTQGLHGVQGGAQPVGGHGRAGGHQGHTGAGVEMVGEDHFLVTSNFGK